MHDVQAPAAREKVAAHSTHVIAEAVQVTFPATQLTAFPVVPQAVQVPVAPETAVK